MSYNCLKCPEILDTQRQLKSHGTAKHQWMRVTRPWCFKETHEYKRPAELKEHCKKYHKDEIQKLAPDFFSESNGVFLSVNPLDYRKIVKPSKWESEDAKDARSAILKWVQVSKEPNRHQKDIEKGLKPENDTVSIYSDLSIGCLKEKEFEEETEEEMDSSVSVEEEYTPCAPEMNEPELEQVSLVPGEARAEYSCHLDVYRVEINDSIYRDVKGMSSLARRMENLKSNKGTFTTGTTYKLNGNNLKEQLLITARILGIDSKHINAVKRIKRDLFKARPILDKNMEKENKRPTPPVEIRKPSPLTEKNDNSNQKQAQSVQPILSSSDTRFEKRPQPKPQSRVVLTLQQRANKILEYGCLPLIPPARRNWDRDEIMKLDGSSIAWPPRCWRKMKSDQKKLCLEFVATSLESKTQPLGNINRTDLLDKYNCLALPGTSEYGSHTDSKVKSKARYYNYEYLRTMQLQSLIQSRIASLFKC